MRACSPVATSSIVAVMAAFWSCTDSGNEISAVTVTDSAGIGIVTNHRTPEDLVLWHTEALLSIGELEGPEEYSFGEIADVEVDGRGRLIVLDRQAQQGMVYDQNGQFRFRFGGAGEGPGEFSSQLMTVRTGALDSIAVLDFWQMRLNVFDADGSPVRTVSMHLGRQGPYQFHLAGDGRPIVRWLTYNIDSDQKFVPWDVLLVASHDQASFDTLMAFDYQPPNLGGLVELLRPMFTNAAFYDLLSDSEIVWSDLDRDHLAIHGLDGRLKRIVRNQTWQRRAANDADRAVLTEVYRKRGDNPDGPLPDNVTFPDSIPAITGVLATPDGGIWVQRMGPLSTVDPEALFLPAQSGWLGGQTWEVYDRDGRWYANVELPQRFRITRVLDSTVVGVQRDGLDVERVVLLKVVK